MATTPSGSARRTGRVYRPGSSGPVGASTVPGTLDSPARTSGGPATVTRGSFRVTAPTSGPLGALSSTTTSRVTSAGRVDTETVTLAGANSTSGTGKPAASTATRRATPPPTAGAKASTRATRSSTWLRPVNVTAAGSASASTSTPAGGSPVRATVTATVEVVIVSRKPMTSAGSTRSTLMSWGAWTLTSSVTSPLVPVRSSEARSMSGVSLSTRRLGPLTDTATVGGRPTGTKPSSTPSTCSGRNMLRSVSEAEELVTNSQIRKAI